MTKPQSGRFPWIKYWPSDWYGDKALRACSLAARGAWADMLCIIHDENAGGYLLLNGKVPSRKEIAKMLGVTEREYSAVEKELEGCGVFSRRASDGAIYSRRIVRESGAPRVPEGCPEDPSPDLSGVPPSRACARASLSPLASSSSPEGSAEGGADPVPSLIEHWRTEWARTRAGTKATVRDKDRAAVAWMLSVDSPENVRRRMTAMLDDTEPFVVKNASLKLLESKWDAYAVAAAKNGKVHVAESPDEVEIRSRWEVMHSRRVRDRKAAGIPPWPGFEAARRELALGGAA